MPHHNLAGELVGHASGYVVESCDTVHPRRRHLNVAAMRFTPDQVVCKSTPVRSKHHALVYVPDNSKHIISIYPSAIPVSILSLPKSGSAIPADRNCRPGAVWLTIPPSLSEMSTHAAPFVPCMAGTEADAPQQGDRQCPGNRRNNAAQNKSPGSSG